MRFDYAPHPRLAGCIYAITNTVTGRVYVGATSGSANRRVALHANYLRRGKGVSKALQRDWDEYGDAAFQGERLEIVGDIADLAAREASWISEMQRRGVPLYNQSRGSVYPSMIASAVIAYRTERARQREQARKRRRRPPRAADDGRGGCVAWTSSRAPCAGR